ESPYSAHPLYNLNCSGVDSSGHRHLRVYRTAPTRCCRRLPVIAESRTPFPLSLFPPNSCPTYGTRLQKKIFVNSVISDWLCEHFFNVRFYLRSVARNQITKRAKLI